MTMKVKTSAHIQSSDIVGGEQVKDPVKQNGLNFSPVTSLISPSHSLTSSDSCASNCSDFSVDAYSHVRGDQEEASTNSCINDSSFNVNGHQSDSSLLAHSNGTHSSNVLVKNDLDASSNITEGNTGSGAEITRDESSGSTDEESGTFDTGNDELDVKFWLPPEPEDRGNDMEGSVANIDDDDDEFGDGLKWGKPSSLSSFGDEGSGWFEEEKAKALHEVKNGKFKALVGQLLTSVGVGASEIDGNNWVDIVTSLSWEAASFVKPDAVEGKSMDADGHVKIKCIATGSRQQSQVIKGLVFKKHAAHKHMPTYYKNPRFLLIQGVLGSSSSGLSSFESLKQEKNSQNSIVAMIDNCHPNVVLVEKTVSRDMQESILAKGMTLVFDMKSNRLERVSRCMGSPIVPSDKLNGQTLRQCDSFHFEKFVEEHDALGEGGKRPSRTLMFLEGLPTRLGCTILLKGSHSDELKRVKCVVQCAVVMAYHLILETSFLNDQMAMFSTFPLNGAVNLLLPYQPPTINSVDTTAPPKESSAEKDLSCTIDIPIANGFHEEERLGIGSEPYDPVDTTAPPKESSAEKDLSCTIDIPIANGFHEEERLGIGSEPYDPVVLSGLSSFTASVEKAIEDKIPLFSTSHQTMPTYFGCNGRDPDGQIQSAIQILNSPKETGEPRGNPDEDGEPNNEGQPPSDMQKSGANNEDKLQCKDDISTVLESESILVLMSRRNASRWIVCDHRHFSHIKFYKNFDVPLGNFLRDSLLNQTLLCKACGEPSEDHLSYYEHHDKQLRIQVRRLPMDKRLPGEAEGKLWMWSCCGKCKLPNGSSKSTKRVLISAAARCLSFGKFLELSFSNHSSFYPHSCGHFSHRDFFYFFGLGPMVAMLRYSPVATYAVSLPLKKMEIGNRINGELLAEHLKIVYEKGNLVFLEVENALKEIRSRFLGSRLNLQGSSKEFSDIEKMLKEERYQFEVDVQNTAKDGDPGKAVYCLLRLNRLQLELLLLCYVWNQRLKFLLSSDFTVNDTSDQATEGKTYLDDATAGEEATVPESVMGNCDKVFEDGTGLNIKVDSASKEISIQESSGEQDDSFTSSIKVLLAKPVLPVSHAGDENCTEDNFSSSSQSGRIIPIKSDIGGWLLNSHESQRGKSFFSPETLDSANGLIWTPFPEILGEYMQELLRGHSPRIGPIDTLAQESVVRDLITQEGSRLHIPLGIADYVVSDVEDELSSIIACALALLKDLPTPMEDCGDDSRREKVLDARAYEYASSLISSPHWSSFGSLDSDGMNSFASVSSEESGIEGLNLLDPLGSLRALHPEISMGMKKLPGKGKYSVVSLYASQFRDLRTRFCSSELDYIASLSRCRNWDAKGGKSKSIFAKTLDDLFIIKEIKRTEYDSFMKFAPYYFRYMNQCYEQGNQTCLAKVLGIYQVTIRQTKSGKDAKHDLMVMENLTFGRRITRQYDLKGALHARFNSAADGSGDVLLDQNFVNDMIVAPFYVSRKAKRNLQRAVWNDLTFLNSINVMDYSLLVGVDAQGRELVCGIIDYLRQYTWDKQLENWVKSSLVVPKNELPTVISPVDYKRRFRKFIGTHLFGVPDHWCFQRSSKPCSLCRVGNHRNASSTNSQERGDKDDDSKAQHLEKRNGFSS